MRIDALKGVIAAHTGKPSSGPNSAAGDARAATVATAEKAAPRPAATESPEAVVAAAKQIDSYLKKAGRTLEFRVDAETNRTIVTVRHADSGEVIRQIPGEEVLKLARHLQSLGGSVNFKV
jgi:flagellar protein FlaG